MTMSKSSDSIRCKEVPFLRGAVFSDLHLGSKRNPTSEKIAKLNKAIQGNPDSVHLDYLFFAGDVYDDNLNHSGEDVIDIDFWIADVLRFCKKNRIKLRVLLGTRSHDHSQPRRFSAINHIANISADLQYIDDVRVVCEDGISILYIPDDVDRDTDRIFHTAKTKMMEQGLEKVDFAIMHGQFEFQLPEVVKAPKHNSQKYLGIVNHYIFIGHVHTHSTYERIVAQGSFDRETHGQEENKGHVRFEVNFTSNERRCKFVVNEEAKVFKTIRVTQKDMEKALDYIRKQVLHKVPDRSYVRIMADKEHPIHANFKRVQLLFPLITFTSAVAESSKQESMNLIDVVETYRSVEITPDNIVQMVIDKASTLTNDSALLGLSRNLLAAIK